ncbi:MAG: TatD family hydrolase [Thomasclavelia sp.]|jgi:TatD DNase family protein|nr:TatD family hydrolase [Thomasclavelia sp.]
MYFDTHCHLNSEQLYPEYDKYIKNALNNKVNKMTVVGTDRLTNKQAVQIASEYDYIYAAVAYGPNDCLDTTDEDLELLDKYLDNDKVVCLGEIGLDYYWDDVPKDKQQEMFRKQIAIAKKHNKPISIHCRDAYEDTYNILKETNHYGILHCYSGSVEMAKRFIELGYYISLAGPVTFKNAKKVKEVAKEIPLDRLLIETDCPYMAPTPLRGTTNEPANVIYIAKEIANLKGISEEEVEDQTTKNALKIFNIK